MSESSSIRDPQVCAIFQRELARQTSCVNLIASENYASQAVMEATGSIFTNKYAEGYPGRRWYGGCQHMDEIEDLAIERLKQLFSAQQCHANVQPHAGSQANTAVYLACLKPGDTILSLDLAHGGHLTAGMKTNISGRLYSIVHYGVEPDSEVLDMAKIRKLAKECRAKLIIAGASAYPRKIDFAQFGQIAREVGSALMCDVAHIAGLIAAGLHPDPVPVSDFVTGTTHKTLRGPRGGFILTTADHAKAVDAAIFPGTQGGPLMNAVAAKAVAFGEALQPQFKQYQQAVIDNAVTLADEMTRMGYRLVTGGTDNHLMLIDLTHNLAGLTGMEAQQRLEAANIIANKNLIPFDKRSPSKTSGIRLGTPAVTTRGMNADHIRQIAKWIDSLLRADDVAETVAKVGPAVAEFAGQFPMYADRSTDAES